MYHESYVRLCVSVDDSVLLASGIVSELLLELGADSFQEVDGGLEAYFPEGLYSDQAVREGLSSFPQVRVGRSERLEVRNWNAEWESTVRPVLVRGGGRTVEVRASFHAPDPSADLHIVVDPKMAFGTGHHATTAMMMGYVLERAVGVRACLDMGCGSGILAILAARLGVASVLAIDNDPWACRNAVENAALNGVQGVEVLAGDFQSVPLGPYGLVLANLMRNLLCEHMGVLAERVEVGGFLAVSGFYPDDVSMLLEGAQRVGLGLVAEREREGWASLLLGKCM